MKGLIRSKLMLTLIALVVLAVVATPMALSLTHAQAAHSATPQFASSGNLDCNGFSKIQKPLRAHDTCTDFKGYDGGRGYDNGRYTCHQDI
jgi:hypothetical protein